MNLYSSDDQKHERFHLIGASLLYLLKGLVSFIYLFIYLVFVDLPNPQNNLTPLKYLIRLFRASASVP